jgi:6-phosphogluconolactonase
MNLRIFDSTDELIRAAARAIVDVVAPGVATSIALSGGSTPKPLYKMLGESPWREELAKSPITWAVVGERYVPESDPQSNSAMIRETLFANGISDGHRFLRFRTELNDPQKTAEEFSREWQSLGLTDLDLILLGIGDDGHTASLFPGTEVLNVEDRIAAAVFVPKVGMWRVTVTKPVIRAAKQRMVLATGASKKPIFEAMRNGADYPIAAVTRGLDETWFFVDRAAAPTR